MYKLYDEYKKTLQDVKKVTRKRQKINAGIREEHKNPYRRKDYNNNKSDITNWNSMATDLEDDMKMMELYLDYDDRTLLHRDVENIRKMIYNQRSYEGYVLFEGLYGESIPDTTDLVCDVELQEEIIELMDKVLTKRQKQIVQMYFWDNMTQEEIAKEIGITQQGTGFILQNSIKNLQNVIKDTNLYEDYKKKLKFTCEKQT